MSRVEELRAAREALIEERRFQAAKAAMQGLLGDKDYASWQGLANDAVCCADALLAELAKPKDLPAHLRDDAPMAICSQCGRRAAAAIDGRWCGMTQPNGSACTGHFRAELAKTRGPA